MFSSQVFLVPSMLMSQPDTKILELLSSAGVPALIVRFPGGCLPPGMFPRLVILFVRWCADEWSWKKQPKFFKNFAQLFLGESGCYSVILTCGLNAVSVSVVRGEDVSPADRLSHERYFKV